MNLSPLKTSPEHAREILAKMRLSVNGCDDRILSNVADGKANLFQFDGGYLVLSIRGLWAERTRLLDVECAEGKGLLNAESFLAFTMLAHKENCTGMIFQTSRKSLVRYAARFGFYIVRMTEDNFYELRKDFKWGNPNQKALHKVRLPSPSKLP